MHLISFTPKRNYRRLLSIVLGLIILAGGAWFILRHRLGTPSLPSIFTGSSNGQPQQKEPNILNGLPTDPALANRRPLAIMVENHPDARPQAGLVKAAIVYEALAEGGITRFMAVFGPFDAEKVGPVRSARQYYVEWAKGMDALYAHVGGSQDALALLRTIGIPNLDQFRYGTRAFHREPKAGVPIEHTMFTSTKLLYDVAQQAGFPITSSLTPYPFQDNAKFADRGTSQTITIPFSSHPYTVVWTFDQNTDSYRRAEGGAPHVDRVTGEQIAAKDVIVATVTRHLKQGGEGFTMDTTGTGNATIYRDGKAITGTWKRLLDSDMMRFYDGAGKEIPLNRGQIWIEIVPHDVSVSVT